MWRACIRSSNAPGGACSDFEHEPWTTVTASAPQASVLTLMFKKQKYCQHFSKKVNLLELSRPKSRYVLIYFVAQTSKYCAFRRRIGARSQESSPASSLLKNIYKSLGVRLCCFESRVSISRSLLFLTTPITMLSLSPPSLFNKFCSFRIRPLGKPCCSTNSCYYPLANRSVMPNTKVCLQAHGKGEGGGNAMQ